MSQLILDENYWDLVLKDGTVLPIPPEYVAQVKQRWEDKLPLHTKTRSIPYHDIVDFRKTGKKKTDVPLLESASQAFKEPMYNEDGDIKARWCKKEVTTSEYNNRYTKIPGFTSLGSQDSGLVTIAFIVPVHLIDTSKVEYCNDNDIRQLTNHS